MTPEIQTFWTASLVGTEVHLRCSKGLVGDLAELNELQRSATEAGQLFVGRLQDIDWVDTGAAGKRRWAVGLLAAKCETGETAYVPVRRDGVRGKLRFVAGGSSLREAEARDEAEELARDLRAGTISLGIRARRATSERELRELADRVVRVAATGKSGDIDDLDDVHETDRRLVQLLAERLAKLVRRG